MAKILLLHNEYFSRIADSAWRPLAELVAEPDMNSNGFSSFTQMILNSLITSPAQPNTNKILAGILLASAFTRNKVSLHGSQANTLEMCNDTTILDSITLLLNCEEREVYTAAAELVGQLLKFYDQAKMTLIGDYLSKSTKKQAQCLKALTSCAKAIPDMFVQLWAVDLVKIINTRDDECQLQVLLLLSKLVDTLSVEQVTSFIVNLNDLMPTHPSARCRRAYFDLIAALLRRFDPSFANSSNSSSTFAFQTLSDNPGLQLLSTGLQNSLVVGLSDTDDEIRTTVFQFVNDNILNSKCAKDRLVYLLRTMHDFSHQGSFLLQASHFMLKATERSPTLDMKILNEQASVTTKAIRSSVAQNTDVAGPTLPLDRNAVNPGYVVLSPQSRYRWLESSFQSTSTEVDLSVSLQTLASESLQNSIDSSKLLVGAFLEILMAAPGEHVNPSILSTTCIETGNEQLGILLLEKMLEGTSEPAGAIEFEKINDFESARKHYEYSAKTAPWSVTEQGDSLNTTQEGLIKCYSQLYEWESLQKHVEQIAGDPVEHAAEHGNLSLVGPWIRSRMHQFAGE
eukprot:jgi/Hompol1/1202/HPOL_005535-RA